MKWSPNEHCNLFLALLTKYNCRMNPEIFAINYLFMLEYFSSCSMLPSISFGKNLWEIFDREISNYLLATLMLLSIPPKVRIC